jgi:hypothetical protein
LNFSSCHADENRTYRLLCCRHTRSSDSIFDAHTSTLGEGPSVNDSLVSDHAVEQNEERYDQLSYLDFRQYCGQSSTSRGPALKLYSLNLHYSLAER